MAASINGQPHRKVAPLLTEQIDRKELIAQHHHHKHRHRIDGMEYANFLFSSRVRRPYEIEFT